MLDAGAGAAAGVLLEATGGANYQPVFAAAVVLYLSSWAVFQSVLKGRELRLAGILPAGL